MRKRRVALPLFLFALTGLSTFWTGSIRAEPLTDGSELASFDPGAGLTYMACVLSILLAHEMGHFLTALYNRVPASLPYFIPMPLMPLGTMGAVIGMQGSQADRRQLFDIGLAGPIAGLLLAVPIAWHGVATALPYAGPVEPMLRMHDPLLLQWFAAHLHPELPAETVYESNPFYLAGWLGLFITGLNMLPVSQLDGGHVAYALLGERQNRLARFAVFVPLVMVLYNAWVHVRPIVLRAMKEGWGQQNWMPVSAATVWISIFVLLWLLRGVSGANHPPVDDPQLSPKRRVVAIFTLALFVLLFMPTPWAVF